MDAGAGDALATTGEAAHFTGGNAVTLLRGGDELFPAMCKAIAAARHEVWLASYIFRNDGVAQTVIDALAGEGARGASAILPGVQRDGSVLLPNQWSLRPVGRQGSAAPRQ